MYLFASICSLFPVLLIRMSFFKIQAVSVKEVFRIHLAEAGQACPVTDNERREW